MTKETKVRLLQTILNAGIKGTDREMLDNLKAVIKAIKSEGDLECALPVPALITKVDGDVALDPKTLEKIIPPFKRKAGRPKKG